MRKGSTEMWWIIIGAVIALIVLIILMVLFVGKTQPLAAGLSECEGKSGVCAKPLESGAKGSTCPSSTLQTSTFSCPENNVCCIGVPKECTGEGDTTTCGKESCIAFGTKFYCTDKRT